MMAQPLHVLGPLLLLTHLSAVLPLPLGCRWHPQVFTPHLAPACLLKAPGPCTHQVCSVGAPGAASLLSPVQSVVRVKER